MNSRPAAVVGLTLILTFQGCSTEPEVDYNKLDDHYFVSCLLFTGWYRDMAFSQRVYVQRIRYLIDFVFNPTEDQEFGIENAVVAISGPDSVFHFEDIGHGVYEYTRSDSTSPIEPGERYALEVIFPDGNEATSELVTPMVYPDEDKDTLWIWPDSITSWTYPESGGRYPLTVQGPNFEDTIRFTVSEGASGHGRQPSIYGYEEWYDPTRIEHLWYRLWYREDTTSYSMIIRTASDSLSVFLSEFEPRKVTIDLGASLRSASDLEYIMFDDEWPVEDLEERSNITGAYGIFTSMGYGVEKEFVLAVKR